MRFSRSDLLIQPAPHAANACPYLELDDHRCAANLTLEHLNEAFDLCMGGYRGCQVYYKLLREKPPALISATCHGKPFQPTG